MQHTPVLLAEIISYFDPQANHNFIDCTINGGGHSLAILKRTTPRGKILGIDFDPDVLGRLSLKIKNTEFTNRLILVNGNFADLKDIVLQRDFGLADGILFDLGMSSEQLEMAGRGFTFLKDEPLDMRFDYYRDSLSAKEIVNRWPAEKLAEILKNYGGERFFKSIARQIAEERRLVPIKTTKQLVEIIGRGIPRRYRHGRIHFATRTFQALRIAVNGELDNFKTALPQTLELMRPGARVAIISFHSLEDKIAKDFIRAQAKEGRIKILTKKPVVATEEEVAKNPRSRSAKLRVFELI